MILSLNIYIIKLLLERVYLHGMHVLDVDHLFSVVCHFNKLDQGVDVIKKLDNKTNNLENSRKLFLITLWESR